MKMFNVITPFPITDNSMIVAAENGWKQTVSNDDIYFKDGKVFVSCYEIDGVVYADPSFKLIFESGLTEQEWFNLFPSGTATLEILPTKMSAENASIGILDYFHKSIGWAKVWETKGKPSRLRYDGIYTDLGI